MRKFFVYALSAILATTTILARVAVKVLSKEGSKKQIPIHEKILKRFKTSHNGKAKGATEKKDVKKIKPVTIKTIKKEKPMAKKAKIK